MNQIAVSAAVIVIVHHAISVAHGWAHKWLGVDLEPWQWAFVYIVIVLAPLVALVLYFTRWRRAGALLLGVSMLAALAFGVFYHFIHISSDHVSHLPEGDARGLFITTAIMLALAEAIGAGFGFWSTRKLPAQPS